MEETKPETAKPKKNVPSPSPGETVSIAKPHENLPSVPVSFIVLKDPIDGINRDGSRSVHTKKNAGEEWVVAYVPQMRHFRIDYERGAVKKTKFVHETNLSDWEPA